MRILVDCSLLRAGGGIQAGLSVLANASETNHIDWSVLASREIDLELPARTRTAFQHYSVARRSTWGLARYLPAHGLRAFSQRVHPDVVFTVFGPAYERVSCTHVVGFAIPRLIYPEVSVPDCNGAIARLHSYLQDVIKARKVAAADLIIVETPVVKGRLMRLFGIDEERIAIVPNGCSPLFMSGLNQNPTRKGRNTFKIIVPSSYYAHKNLELVPFVAKHVKRHCQAPFVFVFTLPEGSTAWQGLLSLAERLGVRSKIQTVGALRHAEIPRLYSDADASFLPSLLECSTAVYPESFASSVPVVTADRDFARVTCGEAALYFDPLCSQSAAVQVRRLMSDNSLRAELISKGKAMLGQNYLDPALKWKHQLRCLQYAFESKRIVKARSAEGTSVGLSQRGRDRGRSS